MIDGTMLIDDLNQKLELDIQTENYDTVSGFLIETLGYIPSEREQEPVSAENLLFEIKEVKDNRITKVLLKIA